MITSATFILRWSCFNRICLPFLQYRNFDLSDLEDRRYEDWKKESESAELFQNHTIALWNKSNGSYDIKEFGTLPLIFSTSKYFRWKFQPWPSFFPHANIPDTWKRGQLSLEQMKKMEKVKVKSHLRYLAACSIQKKRWDIWRIFFSDFRSVFPHKGVFVTKVMKANIIAFIKTKILRPVTSMTAPPLHVFLSFTPP